jgi:hypothetical protein
VEGHDLPLAICQKLVAAGGAFKDQLAVEGAAALADEVLVGRDAADLRCGGVQYLLLGVDRRVSTNLVAADHEEAAQDL